MAKLKRATILGTGPGCIVGRLMESSAPMARKISEQPAPGPFAGFGPRALPFFADLAANQTRDWFLANKAVYEQDVRRPLGALVEALAFAFAAHDIPLAGDAKRSLFRIHRDVRFSKDKSPYKTHAGAVMTRDGTKDSNGLLYIQIGGDPGSFTGIGFYGLEPKDLAVLRHAIVDAPERWLETRARLEEAGLAFSTGHAMTRLPKGFEAQAGSALADDLKLRNLIVGRPLAADRLGDANLLDDIVDFAVAGLPLLSFGWSALDRARGQALAAS
jgi:uncharacterized protein (TIGR02453 family)